MKPGDILDDHLVQTNLGNGAFGDVYGVVHRGSGISMALKVASPTGNPADTTRFNGENDILHTLRPHPNVLEPLSRVVQVPPDISYYTMELADTDLGKYAVSQAGVLNNNGFLEIFRNVCEGLGHAHSHRIAHRDLHWKNILLKLTPEVAVKITDFGRAKNFDNAFQTNSTEPCWGWFVRPPEVEFKLWDSPNLSEAIAGDMYALGIILHSFLRAVPVLELESVRSNISAFINSRPSLDTLSVRERRALYQEWIKALPVRNHSLPVLLAGPDQTARINAVLARLTNVDYVKRFSSIAELQRELAGLTL